MACASGPQLGDFVPASGSLRCPRAGRSAPRAVAQGGARRDGEDGRTGPRWGRRTLAKRPPPSRAGGSGRRLLPSGSRAPPSQAAPRPEPASIHARAAAPRGGARNRPGRAKGAAARAGTLALQRLPKNEIMDPCHHDGVKVGRSAQPRRASIGGSPAWAWLPQRWRQRQCATRRRCPRVHPASSATGRQRRPPSQGCEVMAITCPEGMTQVPDKAAACPECGCPLAPPVVASPRVAAPMPRDAAGRSQIAPPQGSPQQYALPPPPARSAASPTAGLSTRGEFAWVYMLRIGRAQ